MIDVQTVKLTPAVARCVARSVAGLSLAGLLAGMSAGCSMIEGGAPLQHTAAPLATTSPPAAETAQNGPATGAFDVSETPADSPTATPLSQHDPDTSPADLMFQSTEPPVAPASTNVNVFGELDGFGPSVFNMGGKAGYQQHTFVDEGYDADPDISPDGKWIVFSSTRHSNHADIYLQRTDGLAVTQLTTDPADDAFPRFSHDGKSIVFGSNRSGNWDVYVMDIDGNNVQQMTRAQAQEVHPSFSPTGDRIVFSALGSRSGQWELWTVDCKTLERKMIGYGLFPEWSPRTDRDIIAFQRSRQRGTRWFSVWTLELVDDDAKNLTEVAYSTNAAIVAPTWSPDGKRLAFSTIVDPTAAGPAQPSDSMKRHKTAQDIWTVNMDGTDRKRLTDGRGVNATPTWASDNRIYFVSDRAGTESIWSVPSHKARGDATAKAPEFPDQSTPQVETANVPTEVHE